MSLKQQITADMKTAMKAGDKSRLGVIRLLQAAIKQVEVDTRTELGDADVLTVITKMLKQRQDSVEQFSAAKRQDLVDIEQFEIDVLKDYLPEPLSEQEVTDLVQAAIKETAAASMRDMGKVMAILKPKLQGRADMSQVSQLIKQQLAG